MLVVVAHPDDETFGCGSVIAHAAIRGVEVTVCCATRGEAGVDATGTTSSSSELAKLREAELHAAGAILGVSHIELLDFADSDMTGAMSPHALAAVPLAHVVDAVAEVIKRRQPDIVVALDADGLQDHRDHVRIGLATRDAFRAVCSPPTRLYYWTIRRSAIQRWSDEQRARQAHADYTEIDLGRSDEEITMVLDTTDVLARRRAAIAELRSQVSPFAGVSESVELAFLGEAHLVRIEPAWDGAETETELFGAARSELPQT